ncbi:hypothetical protein P7K49_008988 [Saguinus oedipus]|uniref:Uncharacterized protein n=1 Tax=Saguinus oedipus TaxID=9490 RepID=A0ABQ9VZA4_SAGOE|nr:hypothetical protein P7K49_008988 [Saguinus oedipus]
MVQVLSGAPLPEQGRDQRSSCPQLQDGKAAVSPQCDSDTQAQRSHRTLLALLPSQKVSWEPWHSFSSLSWGVTSTDPVIGKPSV